MTKALGILVVCLSLCLVCSADAPTTNAADRDRLELEFAKHWNAYLLNKYGCPPLKHAGEFFNGDACHPAQGGVDYGDFEKARKLAAKVFELEAR